MHDLTYVGLVLFGSGLLLCVFTSQESSRRLDDVRWYIVLEQLTLALLMAGSTATVVGAAGTLARTLLAITR